MILSPYIRKDSPYVWIQWALKPGDKKQYHKTDIRKDDTDHRRRKIASALRTFEAYLLGSGAGRGGDGWQWVPTFLRGRYSSPDQAATLTTYLKQWKPVADFLEASEIVAPSMLERGHAYEYLEDRTAQVKEKSGKNVSHNTARGELKLLGMIMDEAVEQKMVGQNPVRRLRIRPEECAIKPEITLAEEAVIREALKKQPEWMQRSFHVGISTALRFSECRLSVAQVRWEIDDILVEKPKGGRSREFAIPIYEPLRPMLEDWRKTRRRFLYEIPDNVWSPSMAWRVFFDSLGMQHLCFHCTRVTFITRGMRGDPARGIPGIPETVMMKMVNHASKLISRIYQRWTPDDVRSWAKRMAGGQPAAAATL